MPKIPFALRPNGAKIIQPRAKRSVALGCIIAAFQAWDK